MFLRKESFMSKNRLEAFSDGVIAIVITVLVLNLTAPKGDTLSDMIGIEQKLLVYIYSFSIVAVYWNNHHHLFQLIHKINSKILWVNHLFLLTLTLFPLATAWISEHLSSLIPQVLYGLVILLADTAFLILLLVIIQSSNLRVKELLTSLAKKTKFSIALNILAILLGWLVAPILICLTNLFMVALWVVPDKKIEKEINKADKK